MAYLGTPIDTTNQFQSLQGKRFSGDGSTTAFTLDIAPSSVFDIEVFVENVRQDPNSAYGISGTTLTFTGAPPSGTNNIYVIHQAKAVGTIDVPASGVVPASLASNIISGQTELAATPADTDEFLISDAGTIKRIDFSHIKQDNTPAFFAKLSGNQTINNNSVTVMAFDTEVYDTDSAFDTSNYRFTVPSGEAGKYIFTATGGFSNADASTAARFQLMFYKNNASSDFAGDFAQAQNSSADPTMNFTTQFDLSEGDYIDARIYHNASSTETLQSAYARFFGYKLIGV
jgi:hypothetical protein